LISASSLSGEAGAEVVVVSWGSGGGGAGLPQASRPRRVALIEIIGPLKRIKSLLFR
jgi:hypothetical protein